MVLVRTTGSLTGVAMVDDTPLAPRHGIFIILEGQ
jgi:hypothetical protein